MSKPKPFNIGANLGFIEKIVLIDGTVLENMQVLYAAPIPKQKELEAIFCAANEIAGIVFEAATPAWSKYPEVIKRSKLFEKISGGLQ